jgi:hypothetical protein
VQIFDFCFKMADYEGRGRDYEDGGDARDRSRSRERDEAPAAEGNSKSAGNDEGKLFVGNLSFEARKY